MDQQLMQESLLNRLGYHRANLKQLEGSYERREVFSFTMIGSGSPSMTICIQWQTFA